MDVERTADPTPLSRNRDYHILWGSQLGSELSAEIAFVAFPLLVLALSGSVLEMGLVSAVLAAAQGAATVPAGALVDRWNRKKIMLICQAARAVAMIGLGVALLLDVASLPHILVAAAVEGILSAAFEPAEHAALPQVVPEAQLSQAVARNTARPYLATLVGPALAGALFAVHRMVPFAFIAGLLTASLVLLAFLRLPHRVEREPGPGLRGSILDGFRWVFGQPAIRTTLLWLMCCQLAFSALVLIVLAATGETGGGAGETGLTMAALGAGGVLGAGVAARLHAALPAPVILLGFSWTAAAITGLLVLVPTGLLLGVVLGVIAFLVPTVVTTVLTHQLTVTPDRLRGRLSGIVGLCSSTSGAVGPMVAGILMFLTGRVNGSILICAGCLAVVALAATLSPTLRRFPAVRDPTAG